jgi:DNA-binding NarL/FixJ family response regulator
MSLSASLDCPVYEPVSAPAQFATIAPLVSEKTPEPFQPLSSDLGWRAYFKNIGIDAAIIAYVTPPPGAGRHAYMIGFDEARESTPVADGLIAYAEYAWQMSRDGDIVTFRVASGPVCDAVEPASPLPGSVGSKVLGKFDHVAAIRTSVGGSTFSALLFRTRDAGPFSAECKRALVDILPVLSRSAAGDVAAARNDRHAKMLEAMFDRVSLATFLVDMTGRPLFTNAAGATMLDQRTPLQRSADGTIVCGTPAATRDFRAAVRAAASAMDPEQAEIVLRLDTRHGECRLAFVVPAVSRGGDTLSRCAMVLVHAPQTAEAPATLLEALGLLPSEQRFLSNFLRASSLNAAAEDTGLSEETARTYLKRVRAKLGVHRQMELAQLIYGLVPPLRQFCPQPAE